MMKQTIQTSLPFSDSQNELLDLEAASERLGISTATARNWVKSGVLTVKPTQSGKMVFLAEQLNSLKDAISSGGNGRLQARANKKASCDTFIPQEYLASKPLIHEIERCVDCFRTSGVSLKAFLKLVVIQMFTGKDLRPSIKAELDWWRAEPTALDSLPRLTISDTHPDFLGLLYQSLLAEGTKSSFGSYYTPASIAESMVRLHTGPDSTFIDPCCGTGLFLVKASHIITEPRAIWGYDVDELAVRIARINLLLSYPHHEFTPNIHHGNGLLDASGQFDVVATNPPWGGHLSTQELVTLRTRFHSDVSDSFAFFLLAGLRLLKNTGRLSLLLPEAFLNIRTHRNLRRFLLENATLDLVSNLGRVFQNVFSQVVRVDAFKSRPSHTATFIARDGVSEISVVQESVLRADDCIFDIRSNHEERKLMDAVFASDHLTLRGNAEWALGIVTGNNSRCVLDSPDDEAEPIWLGKDLCRFVADTPSKYIRFQPEAFQQVAPTWKYRAAEKLVYRFISNALIFAYDDKQTLVLNSANVLIPNLEGYSIKSVLAFLNSQLFQFIFRRRFQAIKVLKGDIEKLPFPRISDAIDQELSRLVDIILRDPSSADSAYREINVLVMEAFALNTSHRKHVENCTPISLKHIAR
jgi:hypothetical protein